jgi:hypothetical protein
LGWLGFPTNELRPPVAAWVTDGELQCSYIGLEAAGRDQNLRRLRGPKPVTPNGLVDRFVRIRKADDVVRFALRYGTLEFCEHQKPHMHNMTADDLVSGQDSCQPSRGEPLELWFRYVDFAREFLVVAETLQRAEPEPATRESWEAILAVEPFVDAEFAARPTHSGRDELIEALSTFRAGPEQSRIMLDWVIACMFALTAAEIRPRLRWGKEANQPEFDLSASTFGQLVLQLALATTASHGMATCSGCGQIYPRRERQPQRGRRNYCPACKSRGIDARDRQRRSRNSRKGQADAPA